MKIFDRSDKINESKKPKARSAKQLGRKILKALKRSQNVTSTDSGHFHIVNKDGNQTTAQYNTDQNFDFHVHQIKNGQVQPGGKDEHTHSL